MTKFQGQIISDRQAGEMLTLCHKRDWDYDKTYTAFYAFMETVSPKERDDIIHRMRMKV
jgi:hypothetical protein